MSRRSGIPDTVAVLVDVRAGGRCERCGLHLHGRWWSRHHRRARGMGGTKRAVTAADLVVLCGSGTSPGCHRWCEDRGANARVAGYVLSIHSDTPANEVPIRLRDGWAYLHPDGSTTEAEAPYEEEMSRV